MGNAQSVSTQQTQSGIKDAYTQYWIDHLIDRARNMQKSNPGKSKTDIQNELWSWVQEHKSDLYNPFLTLNGKHLIGILLYLKTLSQKLFRKDLILLLTLQWKFSTLFF